MILNFKNDLVLASHTDDNELAIGGTIVRLIGMGAVVVKKVENETVVVENPAKPLERKF
jgi:serine acetyltransferase